MGERKTIDVDLLIVDEENPRFEPVDNEDDALFSILEDQSISAGNKILKLARSIAADGLNPSELLVVSPIEGEATYRVREGNRRVTAIKLSLYPERIPEGFKGLADQFAVLSEAMQQRRDIECLVTDDEVEIHNILTLRHGGENGGIGIVKWNAEQKARFSEDGNPQTVRGISLIESLREVFGDSAALTAIAGISLTNIGRLISTPEVRQALNIDVDGNVAQYLGGHDELLFDVLATIKRDGVKPIYYKRDRVKLVEDAKQRIEPGRVLQTQLPIDEDEDVPGNESPSTGRGEPFGTDDAPMDSTSQSHDDISGYGQDDMQPWPFDDDASTDDAHVDPTDTPVQPSNTDAGDEATNGNARRRKPVSRVGDNGMFGCVLRPAGAKSNDLYRAIDWIDQQYLSNPDAYIHLLPILGFSLRLLLETVAREYYQAQGKDPGQKPFNSFMKDVAKPAIKDKIDSSGQEYLALASEWINKDISFEGLFHMWAHGAVPVERASLVRQSKFVALIINEVWT